MAAGQTSEVIQLLRRGALLRDGAGLTDGQLLANYLSRRDEAVLATLVRRHGPMVWGVCRRVLRDDHDAEDAFQAAFLVFVRKAASIASRELLANWLYGVAHQTALNARAAVARRRTRERQVIDMPEPEAARQDLWDDLQPLLDQELSRLPDKYRIPVVLCDLEGKTRKEAAQQLRCPEGTVAGRLARARVLLARRLTRRGLAMCGGSLAAVLAHGAASASVPTALASRAIEAASLFAEGPAAAPGVVSVKVLSLTEGVLKTMLLTKLKAVAAGLLVCFACLGILASRLEFATAKADEKAAPAAKDDRKEKPKADSDRIQGKWVVVSAELVGKPFQEVVGDTHTFDKNEWTVLHAKQNATDSGTFQLDATKKPKEIDMTTPGLGKPIKGIYELDGDTLKICIGDAPEEGRPVKFASDPEKRKLVLIVLKRAKE
jgi:RNA polymerase sigma factor (sigma-70 family)